MKRIIKKAPVLDENEQPIKPLISAKTLRKQLEEIYKKRRNDCKTKKRTEPKHYLKGGLWQKIKAKQKNNS